MPAARLPNRRQLYICTYADNKNALSDLTRANRSTLTPIKWYDDNETLTTFRQKFKRNRLLVGFIIYMLYMVIYVFYILFIFLFFLFYIRTIGSQLREKVIAKYVDLFMAMLNKIVQDEFNYQICHSHWLFRIS